MVDDAIVVVENVERHVREGRSRLEAALIGARELVGPIIAMTITLAAVYAPIGFQGGLTGSLFLEFAITLAAAVLVSTVRHAVAGDELRFVHEHGQEGRLTAWSTAASRRKRVYARLLDGALHALGHRGRLAPDHARGLAAVHLLPQGAGRRSRTRATSPCSCRPRPTPRWPPSTRSRRRSSAP